MFAVRYLAALIGFALAVLLTARADARQKPAEGEAAPHSSIQFVTDAKWRQVLLASCEAIKDEAWKEASFALQQVLNSDRDFFVPIGDPDDPKKPPNRWQSMKFVASELIGSMPAKGREVYEKTHGRDAKALLDIAALKKDDKLLTEVVVRYRHTKAGGAALALLAERVPLDAPKADGWPAWRGNAANTGQATGSPPLLDKKLWSRPICGDKFEDLFDWVNEDKAALAALNAAIKQVRDLKQPVLPGFFPIATQGMVIYRTQRDIRAVAIKETRVVDDLSGEVVKVKPGEFVWVGIPMNRGLATLLERQDMRAKADTWINDFAKTPGFNSVLYENALIGTLSADDKNVYAINDLGVPPHPLAFQSDPFARPVNPPFALGDQFKPLAMQNDLLAYDVVTGKLKWDLGLDDPQFKDSHFLSAPISLGGKLYVLNEKSVAGPAPKPGDANLMPGESELRLVCIDPNKTAVEKNGIKPKVVAVIALGTIAQEDRMLQSIRRRVNAMTPAFADGILVCPTGAGELLGIDLLTRRLAWSFSYRDMAPSPIVLPGMPAPKGGGTTVISKWKSSPPAIHDGKVLFTAPDADSIHCVSLRDGKPLWRKDHQPGDRYFAGVFANRVMIVADKSIRGLDLKDGSQLWSLDLDSLPTGQGTASDGIYYLPLAKEIAAIDVARGIVKARHRVPAGAASPGNLLFYQGMLLSQSATDVTAYPRLKFDK
jgi:outer membrane protein assembly factor BamB